YELFRSALREDSTFAMAAYYAVRAAIATNDSTVYALQDRAIALAPRAPPRDRLLILAHVGATRSEPRALSAAETLAMKYPQDPEALVRAAQVIPDLARATALLNSAI